MRKRRIKKSNLEEITNRAMALLPETEHSPGDPRCYIIDGMHFVYRAHYAHANFRYMGKPTSIIFGVIQQLKSLLIQDRPGKVVFCWDGSRHPERIRLYPEYKSHRENNMTPRERKSFLRQIKYTKKLLYYLGIPQAYNPNMEGDDMVYWVVKKMVNIYPITIYSGDKDFKQLVSRDVMIQTPREKYGYAWQTFFIDQGVEIHQYVDYLCLTGDDSDDIEGYRGIGPVRAKQFLKLHKSIREYLKDRKAEYSGMMDKDKLKEIWKRNRMLIDLKRFNEKHHRPEDVLYINDKRNPEMQEDKVKEICLKFGLKTFMFDSFLQPFKDLQNA